MSWKNKEIVKTRDKSKERRKLSRNKLKMRKLRKSTGRNRKRYKTTV